LARGGAAGDVLTRRQVDVVRLELQLLRVDPELEEPGVDVDERRSTELRQQAGLDAVFEVQQEVGAPKDRKRLSLVHAHVLASSILRSLALAHRVQN
jgi:hypothetical protein